MLLTAVVLVIGFVALAGVVARVQQAGEATARIQDNTVREEAIRISSLVDDMLAGVKENQTTLPADEDTDAFRSAVNRSLAHLTLYEQQRGLRLTYTYVCDGALAMRIEIRLHDPTAFVSLRSSDTIQRAACL